MSLKRQLLLTAVSLVFAAVLAAAVAVVWNDAHLQIVERATLVAGSSAKLRDPIAMQRFAESMAGSEGESVRIVDPFLLTLASSAESEAELTDADRAQLRAAMDDRRARTYQDAGRLKAAAPMIDAAGQVAGGALLAFPTDWLQAAIGHRLQAAAPSILLILAVGAGIACLWVLMIMKPVVRLDAAVAALGSYRFKPETLDDLAKRTNELGRMAKLLQRMSNAEQGWRRSLEALRQTRDELEQRVEERTRDLTVALQEQTTLNNQLQVMGAGFQRSIEELRSLAEVSRAISFTPDAQQLLATILTHAVRLSKSDAGTIYEFNESRGTFVMRASDGIDPELVERHGQPRETAIIGQAALQRQPTQIPDLFAANGSADEAAQELGFRSLLAVPLLKEGSLVGGIVLRRRAPGDFEPETVSLLQTIAVQSVLAVGPHGVSYQNRWSVETTRHGSEQADLNRLRAAVQQSMTGAAQAAAFRKDRLGVIRANEGPIEFPPTGKIVFHMMPATSSDPAVHYDIFPAVKYLAPLGRSFSSQGVNFDGILTCERSSDHLTAYAQGFWNGRIEMVDSLLLSSRADGRKQVPTRALEDSLIRTLDLCRLYYEQLEIPPPFSLGLALLGVRGYRLAVDDLLWSDMSNHPIERTDLVFPEILIERGSKPSEAILRPLFDLLWNACGFQRCLDYDASGAWSPRSWSPPLSAEPRRGH